LSVIIVLRNQIDYAKSLYMEFIKWGGILTFEEFMRSTIRNAKYNYLARYRAWSNISDSVEVIDFDRHKSSLIQTFVKALNLIDQLDAASAESHKTNESVSADFMEFVRMMNTCIPKEGRRNNYLELLESFSKNSPEMLQKRSWGFSQPPRFAEFLDATSVQNEELARILRVSKKTFLGGSVTSRAKQASKLENPSMSRVINCLHHANGQALR